MSHLLAGRAVLCVAVVVIPQVLNASLWRQLRRDAIRPLHISAYTTSATAVSHTQQAIPLLLHHFEDICERLPQNQRKAPYTQQAWRTLAASCACPCRSAYAPDGSGPEGLRAGALPAKVPSHLQKEATPVSDCVAR